MIVTVIRTSGAEEVHELPAGDILAVQNLIGAEMVDTVHLRNGQVMVVDDDGWETVVVPLTDGRNGIEAVPLTPKLPINEKATALYLGICEPGTTHKIAGDVVIVRDEDFA